MEVLRHASFFQYLEAAIVFCSIAYLVLIATEQKIGWWFGAFASLGSIYFFIQINLFADALLSVYYVGIAVYGYFHWKQGGSVGGKPRIRTCGPGFHAGVILAGCLFTWLLAMALIKIGSDYPYADAATTVFSFITTWMTARKVLENWIYWVVIDGFYVWLYQVKDAPLYSSLMALYSGLAVVGFYLWLRQYRNQTMTNS